MNNIVGVAIFGSGARGTLDERSDFDVVVAVADASHVRKEKLLDEIESFFGFDVGLSIYTANRLNELSQSGSPFAWHLFLESIPVFELGPDIREVLGVPVKYKESVSDCKKMMNILNSCQSRLNGEVFDNYCYEAGLIYVGCRNLGMFASLEVNGSFNFTRYSPYVFEGKFKFPLKRKFYEKMVNARHASMRGCEAPKFAPNELCPVVFDVLWWAEKIIFELEK